MSPHPDGRLPATGELADLAATLQKQRRVMLDNLDGLRDEQATTPTAVSTMPLLGIVQHLGYVERRWIHMGAGARMYEGFFPPDPDKEMAVAGRSIDEVVATYRERAHESDEVIASFTSGDDPCRLEMLRDFMARAGGKGTVREVVLHLIEETARHAGQANIIREAIDGRTGD